jgi:hypothetical protein
MSLTLKVTVGVFLGIVAAFLAIKAPSWIRHAYQQNLYDNAFDITTRLTPDLVIRRCGKPDMDVVNLLGKSDTGSLSERLIYYANHDASYPGVIVEFLQGNEDRWHFQSMETNSEAPKKAYGVFQINGLRVDAGDVDKTAYLQVLDLPCLGETQH